MSNSRKARVGDFFRTALSLVIAAACSDDTICLALPCAAPLAATIAVNDPNMPAGIANLTMTVTGAVSSTGPCTQGTTSTCVVMGGPGRYHIALQAPGYVTATRDLIITGTEGGCNSCGHVDAQNLSIELQRAS